MILLTALITVDGSTTTPSTVEPHFFHIIPVFQYSIIPVGAKPFMFMGSERKTYKVVVASDECKGCYRCVDACPVNLMIAGEGFNVMGYSTVEYVGKGCTGCGNCFYACPEPGAITIVEIVED